jgi:hypothetical protein
MKKILSAVLALSLLMPGLAHADDKVTKRLILTGTGLMVASFVMMAAASDEVSTCVSGTVVRIYDQRPACVYVGARSVTIDHEGTRPVTVKPRLFNAGKNTFYASMAFTGAGLVAGIVNWKRAKKVKKVMPDVTFTPESVTVGKTLRW